MGGGGGDRITGEGGSSRPLAYLSRILFKHHFQNCKKINKIIIIIIFKNN